MDTILGTRQSGKTTELIKKCAIEGGYIVCGNMKEAQSLAKRAKEMKLKINLPMIYEELINRNYHPYPSTKFHIDDIDRFLNILLRGREVSTITVSVPSDKCIMSTENKTIQYKG